MRNHRFLASSRGPHGRRLPASLMLAALLLSTVAATAQTQGPDRVKVLVAFSQQPGPAEQALVRSLGGKIRYTYHLVPAIAATIPTVALDGLRHNPRIIAVEPDRQVHLLDSELDAAWGVKHIGAGAVHDLGNLGAGVKVGILDSGIDLDHPDLSYDPSCSANFVDGETLNDGHSHGTHVAGIVAAQDNGTGVVGVAPGATLCIYKVFDSSGDANYSDIVAAVERAVDDGVQVANHSWGDPADPGTTVKDAMDNAAAAGVLQIAAAGNQSLWIFLGDCIYPAKWGSVVATAATTQSDTRAGFSSVCAEMELAAPGDQIYSTLPGGYGYKSGTSMASPHAAGTAALILAANPGWSSDQVRAQLQVTADDLGDPGHDSWYGFGLVDADEAAGGLPPNTPPVADDQSVTVDEDTSLAVTLTASDADGDALTYHVVSGPGYGSLAGAAPNLTYTPDPHYNGTDSFAFVANDGQLDSAAAMVSITISAVNDPPFAQDESVSTSEDTPITIILSASDVDGDALTYEVLAGPTSGTLSGNAPALTYSPTAGFSGSDSFAFVANDGQVDSNVAAVIITVVAANEAPMAHDQGVTTEEDTPLAITLTGADPDGDPLTYSVVAPASHGTLEGVAPDVTYLGDPNYSGHDTFTFVVNDGILVSDEATVSISVVPVNDPPSAAFVYTCMGLVCNFDASLSSDVEGALAGYQWDFGDGETGSGIASSHSYGSPGTFDVSLTVTDGEGASDTELQSITVADTTPSMHVGDLDGGLVDANKNFWWAEVTISIHDQDEGLVADATVQGSWTGGASGGGTCQTGADGSCTLLSPKISTSQGSISFVVDGVAHASLPYQPANNHDLDGDSDGSSIIVSQAGNQPPVAHFTYTCTELTCSFDGSDSYDPDGDSISYGWAFGDGATDSGANATHTYAEAGTYVVVLTVTDDGGAEGRDSQSVSVGVSAGTMFVFDVTLEGKTAGPNRSATALVTIRDSGGSAVAGATVSAIWSGDYAGPVSGVTAADGTVAFSSANVRQANANFTLSVEGVVHELFVYDPALNQETSDSIVVP